MWRSPVGLTTVTSTGAGEAPRGLTTRSVVLLSYVTSARRAPATSTAHPTANSRPVTTSGQYTFAGVEDSYFAGVFLPAGASSLELTTFSDQIPKDGKDVARVGAAVGGEGLNSFELYVGPKDLEILKRVNPKPSFGARMQVVSSEITPSAQAAQLEGAKVTPNSASTRRGSHRKSRPPFG